MKIKITLEAGDRKAIGEEETTVVKQREVQTLINKLYRKLKREMWNKKEQT